jgi:hypothetical protein
MKPPAKPPIFLERASYRQRRFGDAARFLPLLGLVLWLLPLLWAAEGGETPSNAGAIIYIFAVWLALMVAAAALSRVLRDTDSPRDDARR